MSKRAMLLIAVLAVSSLVMVEFAVTQTMAQPSVPEFTVKYVDYSYDVPQKTTPTTDPYTGKAVNTTTPGYRVSNKTIEATIKNNLGASYYNFRYKGHYESEWSYYPFGPNGSLGYMLPDAYAVPYKAQFSDSTVVALPSYFFKDIREGGEVDVQVQALFGDFRAVPYGHINPLPGGETYDFYFEGTTSDWSSTQTATIGESQTLTPSPATTPTPPNMGPTSSPAQAPLLAPEQLEIVIVAAIVVAVIGAGLGLLIYLAKRK